MYASQVLVGPETLTDVSHAAMVPSLKVSGLDGTEVDLQALLTAGKVTLLLTSFKNFGLNMLPAWREPFQKQFAGNTRVQTLTVNIIEDWYMKLVAGSITRGLQKQTPAEELPFTFAHFGRCDEFRTPLDLNNSFVGYAHLVDGKGRIRWMYEALRFDRMLMASDSYNLPWLLQGWWPSDAGGA